MFLKPRPRIYGLWCWLLDHEWQTLIYEEDFEVGTLGGYETRLVEDPNAVRCAICGRVVFGLRADPLRDPSLPDESAEVLQARHHASVAAGLRSLIGPELYEDGETWGDARIHPAGNYGVRLNYSDPPHEDRATFEVSPRRVRPPRRVAG